MAKDKSQNTDAEELRGGTQGGAAPAPQVGNSPGGTNSLSPAGTARPLGHTAEPPTGDKEADERQDPQRAVEGGRTKPSASAAAQRARDEANVAGSESAIDMDNPRQIPEDAPTPDESTDNG